MAPTSCPQPLTLLRGGLGTAFEPNTLPRGGHLIAAEAGYSLARHRSYRPLNCNFAARYLSISSLELQYVGRKLEYLATMLAFEIRKLEYPDFDLLIPCTETRVCGFRVPHYQRVTRVSRGRIRTSKRGLVTDLGAAVATLDGWPPQLASGDDAGKYRSRVSIQGFSRAGRCKTTNGTHTLLRCSIMGRPCGGAACRWLGPARCKLFL
jgi:hypothetical protein